MPTAVSPQHRPTVVDPAELTTRRRVLRLVVEAGPACVVELARDLNLSAPGVRRHVAALEDAGEIAVHTVQRPGAPRRGRPARRYVATDRGQAALNNAYSDLAGSALAFLSALGGPAAVQEFAQHRVADLGARLQTRMDPHATVADRVGALAIGLAEEGYAASARPVPGGRAVQLCQGHCPVQDVAAQFPQLCEAESQLFSRLLGVHVQRLSTLAAGGHVCTTHVPANLPTRTSATPAVTAPATSDRPAPAGAVEGTR